MSGLRIVFRHVHGQQHELSLRGHRHSASGNGTIPAVDSGRIRLAKHAGMAIMNLVEKDIKARDIINEKSIKNALACDMALGCSSNSVLHLLAIANEAGIELDLNIFNEFSAKVPNLCHLAPAGPTHHARPQQRRRTHGRIQ